MNAGHIEEILAQYRKFGWELESVLLTEKLRGKLSADIEKLFGAAEIRDAEINAAWLTRDSGKSRSAWELRHLSETPFAVFETFEKDIKGAELEENKREMETRLAKILSKRNN